MYPRSLFKDKQEAEASKKEKEFKKLQEKQKGTIMHDNPKTIRDKMMCLIAQENRKEPDQALITKLRGEIFHTLEHVPIEFDPYMAFVKPLIDTKKQELEAS